MSASISSLQVDQPQKSGPLMRAWRWITAADRPPVLHLQVEHQTTCPARFALATRLIWNSVFTLFGAALIALPVTAFVCVMRDHPELILAVRQFAAAEITRWESENGITCFVWEENVAKPGKPDNFITVHGGPTCPAEGPLPPADGGEL